MSEVRTDGTSFRNTRLTRARGGDDHLGDKGAKTKRFADNKEFELGAEREKKSKFMFWRRGQTGSKN